jgi:murein DD-endopeptidase MepM/ murein hydrolase activator NlpD
MRVRGLLVTFVTFIAAVGGFLALIWSNAVPSESLRAIIPTEIEPTEVEISWQDILRSGVIADGSAVPTVEIPVIEYVPPTLAVDNAPTATPIDPALMAARNVDQQVASAVTPTLPPPTGVIEVPGRPIPTIDVVARQPTREPMPPSLPVPLSRDAMGWDHFFFIRPIDSLYRNYGLDYYEYGTDGPQDDPYRIHHGIDMPNPVGTTVRAAGSGTVTYVWSEEAPVFQNSPTYGKVLEIEHDFGFRGQKLYTLYAHLEAILVEEGDYVQAGQAVALLGNTGQSTGPHVQFEVRMGRSTYGTTYNPVLWMAPYVGHGVIAGRVVDERGNFLDDVDVTIQRGGFPVRRPTSTYVFREVGSRVNSDPNWNENFVFGDIPVGTYEVAAMINGRRVSQIVTVVEGITTFVELKPPVPLPAASPTGVGS